MIAKVNGRSVTKEDVEVEIDGIISRSQQNIPPEHLEEAREQVRKQAVETCINRVLLFAEADRRDIQASPEMINERMTGIIRRFPSEQAFNDQLTKTGATRAQIENGIGQQIRIDLLVQESISLAEIDVSEEEISSFYKNNPDSFVAPEEVRASHILFKTEETDSDSVKSQKRLELAGLLGQIEKGDDFAEVAKKHSDCPSKEKGGDLGYFERGAMVKPFEKVAFDLKPGELSDIVETRFGYHLIKVMDRRDERIYQFNEVKEQIFKHLVTEKEQDAFVAYINELRQDATIEYLEG